ncbi:MAG: GDP-mannose 4,6-dehydratase [Deltaproteobacteria bacterium]|nr:GDP-mannose 4,6-dehydratase [Deltaproteobacteria bacterium]
MGKPQARDEVLVTGAGGFIGSHLTASLADLGLRVRALVRYNGRADTGHLRFLTPAQQARVQVILGNVEDPGCVDAAVAGCRTVFHLAALIGIPYSYVAPRSYVTTNILGTQHVLDAARRHGVHRVVHTSTSEVYGTARYVPIDEEHPLQGQSPYSATKIAADKLAESYHLSFGLPVVTVRPFNTFGPRQSARAVIPSIIVQLLGDAQVLRLGSLEPRRDFTYVEDTVAGFVAAATADAAVGCTVNLGSGASISIGDLAARLVAMVRPGVPVESAEERVRPDRSEVMHLECHAGRARELLGWAPRVGLDEGLARTVSFLREHPAAVAGGGYTV